MTGLLRASYLAAGAFSGSRPESILTSASVLKSSEADGTARIAYPLRAMSAAR